MKLYKCCSCGIEKPATKENYYTKQIQRSIKENVTGIGKCISCAKEYGAKYRDTIKEKRLSMKSRKPIDIKKPGTLYIIGPKENSNCPYKIGITVGKDLSKRLTAIQTSHWLEMQVYYASPILSDVIKLENYFHKKYKDKKVRGEWFNITNNDIQDIKKECEIY